jgi:nitrite reductase/ring-hydroxylating ferredoxin subunit
VEEQAGSPTADPPRSGRSRRHPATPSKPENTEDNGPMSEYICIAHCSDCPPGEARELVVAGRLIALFNVDGQFFALDGVCPHQGGPLAKGTLCGQIVTCPWHGWQFDVRDGQHQISATMKQPTIPVKVQDGEILVHKKDL